MQSQQSQTSSSDGTPSPPVVVDVFQSYRPLSNVYDEMFLPGGERRDGWRPLIETINHLGTEEISRRWVQAERLVHENGVAFGAYGDPLDKPRPWELDPIPLLITEQEWQTVSTGLQQRMQILEMTLADIAGEKKLIKSGVLPPDVVFLHPGYHTQLFNIKPAQGRFLHFYAADLGRSPTGHWQLLGDRSEAPSGTGYSLENRVVTSRMLPEAFRDCQVQRLANYFATLRDTCHEMSPRNKDNPRIVILSNGPANGNYFEDAYLSRYLGFTLVEGPDLTVRDRRVWLKTLGGLYPVDVILRRPNTADCDSLEIPSTSGAAIPGLFDAARAGNVAITNPLGSGLVESPIFMRFMPELAKTLLGQELILPSVRTWWCGDANDRAYVLSHLEELEIKRAFRQRGFEHRFTQQLRELPTEVLRQKVESEPGHFIAQERVTRSTMAKWTDGGPAIAHLALRGFCFTDGANIEVLPGGLTRTSKQFGSLELSLAAGEGSKDTWVQDSRQEEHHSLLPERIERVTLRRAGDDLPSRVADDLFWLGRKVERADFAARLLRAVCDRMTGERGGAELPEIPVLLKTMADQGQIEPGCVVEGIREQLPTIELMLPEATFDANSDSSLRSILASTYSNASRVRDRLSADSWRAIVRIDERFRRPVNCDVTDLLNMSSELIVDLAAFIGMISESMTRTQAFHFMDLGVRVERTWQLCHIIYHAFAAEKPKAGQIQILESILHVCDSLMTYRYRYLSHLHPIPVLDLLITDETNPRSVLYQLLRIKDHVDRLPRLDAHPLSTPEQKILLSLLYSIRMLDVETLGDALADGDTQQMSMLFEQFKTQLPRLSQSISDKYMVHAGPSKFFASFDLLPSDQP